ncbi:hypothetical protein PQR14_36625 [Paraburkholderia bryophila]|jgi:hypothetical protein|uniref:hypothetical protein n=1 Tax=Paraburkholderia bryophila TaxID=420952 RepID=UPI000E74BE04
MNKTVFVKAYFKPIYKDVAVKVATGETKAGFFGGQKDVTRTETQRQQAGWSDCEIDGRRLADEVSKAIAELNSEGYEAINVSEITSGSYRYEYNSQGITSSKRILSETEKVSGGGSYGFGYGYSYTEGVLILARRV